MLKILVAIAAFVCATVAVAQESDVTASRSSLSMANLIKQGYEIKSSSWTGSKLFVFLQKDKSAYACEFANVANTRCGSIN
ncbi:hypothetical protein [Rhizobium sp. SL42]|uniref:hypothetical protein n=1 Tax=Rhizobium sp. SL42 TaxID=2806346 RepID=UPI001F36BBF7|nr:hypothetical protein [Rhizobium sp. SL42]UJW73319.1 hypothetical protein IM739_10270 [Rhizobium sp. SL42]